MNKKGFTLAELLAAITILAVISIVTTTVVVSFLKKSKEDLYQKQLNNIKLAAKVWVSDHKDDIGECRVITLEELQKDGYIDDNIKDPVDGKELNNTKVVVNITKEGKTYKYELSTKGKVCTKEYAIGDEVTLTNHDNEKYHVIGVGDDYLTLLKDQPLTINEVEMYGYGHINRNTYKYIETVYNYNGYGSIAFYSSDTCGWKNQKWSNSGCTNDYNSSDVKYVVDRWSESKFNNEELIIDEKGYKARLIMVNELENLGYSYSPNEGYPLNSQVPNWIWSSKYYYWTMSPVDADYCSTCVWYVGINGDVVDDSSSVVYGTGKYYYGTEYFGLIRPVVEIKKSALEGGNNNE